MTCDNPERADDHRRSDAAPHPRPCHGLIFDSLRRWNREAAPTEELPVTVVIAATRRKDEGGHERNHQILPKYHEGFRPVLACAAAAHEIGVSFVCPPCRRGSRYGRKAGRSTRTTGFGPPSVGGPESRARTGPFRFRSIVYNRTFAWKGFGPRRSLVLGRPHNPRRAALVLRAAVSAHAGSDIREITIPSL